MTSFLLFGVKMTFTCIFFFSFFSISLTCLPEPHIWIWINLNSSSNHILHFFTLKFLIQPPSRNPNPRLALQSASFILIFLNIVRATSQNSTDWCHYKFLNFNLHHILRIILSFHLRRFTPLNISLNNYIKTSIFSQILSFCLLDTQLLPQLYPKGRRMDIQEYLPWLSISLSIKGKDKFKFIVSVTS